MFVTRLIRTCVCVCDRTHAYVQGVARCCRVLQGVVGCCSESFMRYGEPVLRIQLLDAYVCVYVCVCVCVYVYMRVCVCAMWNLK